jgi:acylphosphatase
MIGRLYLVSGKVQGVGYRRFVEKQALALGLRGGVRNLRDGRVEVWALGSGDQHGRFEEELRRGPMFSSVENVFASDVTHAWSVLDTATDFRVHVDGGEPWSIT